MKEETESKCEICGKPMPEGEEMFRYHGYSGPCPKYIAPLEAEIERLKAENDIKKVFELPVALLTKEYAELTFDELARLVLGMKQRIAELEAEIEKLKLCYEAIQQSQFERIAALEAENAKLREDIEELMRVFRHTHKAHYIDGMLTDICDTCQFDLRHQIHFRKGEP